jgi:AcrR family transcriptional regulator
VCYTDRMTSRVDKRLGLLDRMADHLLDQGLDGASLRPLAAAAGTSDRMLLYYFADKEELLTAVLEHVAGRMAALLGQVDASPRAYAPLLAEIVASVRAPAFAPYMHLWIDLAAQAARGREPYRAIAGRIADGFLAWVAHRLQPSEEAARGREAALLLATVDGLALIDAVGRRAAADEAMEALPSA